MRNSSLIAMLLIALAGAVQADTKEQAASPAVAGESAQQEAKRSPQQQAMDKLAEIGMRQATKAISKSGSMYPFALIQSGDTVQGMGFQGEEEERPSAEQWAQYLFRKLEKLGEDKPDVDMMALFRLHEVENKDGEVVPGIWAQVDHRDVRPWVIFLPLVKNDEGKHELGEMIYYATEQPLFKRDETGE